MRSRDPMMYKSRSKCRCVSDDDKCDGDENLWLFIIEDNLKGDQGGIRKKGVGVDRHKCKNNNKEIRLCLTSWNFTILWIFNHCESSKIVKMEDDNPLTRSLGEDCTEFERSSFTKQINIHDMYGGRVLQNG